jgi:hypothetical protein
MEAEAAAKARMMSLRMSLSLVDLSSGYKLPAGWREVSLNKTNAKKVLKFYRSKLPVQRMLQHPLVLPTKPCRPRSLVLVLIVVSR